MPKIRSAGSVIYRIEKGKPNFLLLKYGWGHWGFPKGKIENGESAKEAAIREIKEETGLISFRFVNGFKESIEYSYIRKMETNHKEVVYFLAETEKREVKTSYEHSEHKWLRSDEAMNRLTFENDKEILRKANKMIRID